MYSSGWSSVWTARWCARESGGCLGHRHETARRRARGAGPSAAAARGARGRRSARGLLAALGFAPPARAWWRIPLGAVAVEAVAHGPDVTGALRLGYAPCRYGRQTDRPRRVGRRCDRRGRRGRARNHGADAARALDEALERGGGSSSISRARRSSTLRCSERSSMRDGVQSSPIRGMSVCVGDQSNQGSSEFRHHGPRARAAGVGDRVQAIEHARDGVAMTIAVVPEVP